jgi:peroxiredoxin
MVDPQIGDVAEQYNYERFTRSEVAGKTDFFKNVLRVGDEAPDFELPSTDGRRVRLSAFRSFKHIVLVFGSIT